MEKKNNKELYYKMMVEKKLFPITFKKDVERNKDKIGQEPVIHLKDLKKDFI